MTEAAQANRDGLECSSYAWQVRQRLYAVWEPECQAKLAPGEEWSQPNVDKYLFINKCLK